LKQPLELATELAARSAAHARLLLDPYACFAPGSEAIAPVLRALAHRAGDLGLALCVEESSWNEGARDPDVLRRRVDLSGFEPLLRLPELPLPTARDRAAYFAPATSEAAVADLQLLGALHARRVDLLVAAEGRLHRLAARAGLSDRVLTPGDALAWAECLAGNEAHVTVRELEARAALEDPALESLLVTECDPWDPYLRARLEAGGGRVLAAMSGAEALALAVVTPSDDDDRLELRALAAGEAHRGMRVFEPLVAAAIALARRRGRAIDALLPPHDDLPRILLEQLGFEARGRDRHGRDVLGCLPGELVLAPAPGGHAWIVPLTAAQHDRWLPEMAGLDQAQLLGFGGDRPAPTLGSTLLKQLLLPSSPRAPVAGDLLAVLHGREPGRAASASITAVARIQRVARCNDLAELLPLTARRPGPSLDALAARLDAGAIMVVDVRLLGRLERLVPLAVLREREVVGSVPSSLRRLDAGATARLLPLLSLC
jgi:hypothetical protein